MDTHRIIEHSSHWELQIHGRASLVFASGNSLQPNGKIPFGNRDASTIIDYQLGTGMIVCLAGPDRLIVAATDNHIAVTLYKQSVALVCCAGTPDRITVAALKNEIALIGQADLELSIC